MKTILNIVASLLVLAGIVWFLQGINVLPGSFMSGQTRWAINGAIAVAAGVAMFLWANRRRKKR
jgi:uncharacterized membrane protein HdeD (DUF308 family)